MIALIKFYLVLIIGKTIFHLILIKLLGSENFFFFFFLHLAHRSEKKA